MTEFIAMVFWIQKIDRGVHQTIPLVGPTLNLLHLLHWTHSRCYFDCGQRNSKTATPLTRFTMPAVGAHCRRKCETMDPRPTVHSGRFLRPSIGPEAKIFRKESCFRCHWSS